MTIPATRRCRGAYAVQAVTSRPGPFLQYDDLAVDTGTRGSRPQALSLFNRR